MDWSIFGFVKPVRDRVLDVVPSDREASTADIATAAGIPTKAARQILNRMHESGVVERRESGLMILWKRK